MTWASSLLLARLHFPASGFRNCFAAKHPAPASRQDLEFAPELRLSRKAGLVPLPRFPPSFTITGQISYSFAARHDEDSASGGGNECIELAENPGRMGYVAYDGKHPAADRPRELGAGLPGLPTRRERAGAQRG